MTAQWRTDYPNRPELVNKSWGKYSQNDIFWTLYYYVKHAPCFINLVLLACLMFWLCSWLLMSLIRALNNHVSSRISCQNQWSTGFHESPWSIEKSKRHDIARGQQITSLNRDIVENELPIKPFGGKANENIVLSGYHGYG